MTKIGFIGLGRMGTPMVANLIQAGHELHVFDVVEGAVLHAEKLGAKAHQSIANLAREVDCVITMVQTGDQIKEICLNESGLFAHVAKDIIYIDCSSIDISVSREIHAIALQKGIAMVDAPVSGGVAGAEAANLTIMVGGCEHDFKTAEKILRHLGKKIIYAGDSGSGQAAKICNNLLLGISMIGVSEAFNLAKALGLDARRFFEISSNSSGQCWSMTSYCPEPGILKNVPSDNHYQPGFPSSMMLKDLKLGHAAAEAAEVYTPLGDAARELYASYVESYGGELDFSSIINYLSKQQEK